MAKVNPFRKSWVWCRWRRPSTENRGGSRRTLAFAEVEGLRLRSALGSEAVRSATKKREDGGCPPLGLREGKFLPGRLLADALQDIEQYSEDEIRAYWKGSGKSRGKGGGGKEDERRGQGKRAAERRGSSVATEQGRTAKLSTW